jgi:hypothetical protein
MLGLKWLKSVVEVGQGGGQGTLRESGETCTTCDSISAWHLDASESFAQGSSGAASGLFPPPTLAFLLTCTPLWSHQGQHDHPMSICLRSMLQPGHAQ